LGLTPTGGDQTRARQKELNGLTASRTPKKPVWGGEKQRQKDRTDNVTKEKYFKG